MKYKFYDRIQETTFSCLEELKCDIIENLLLTPEEFRDISIISKSDLAENLLSKLLDADINGFSLKLHPYFAENDLSNEEYIIIDVLNDGYVFMGKADLNTYFETDFVYLSDDMDCKWLEKFSGYKNDILFFNIK